ncbi:TonB-dependent copper receptor [uncultured Acinetobacter sp.]|uniref:TonB-dependent copper receptor n=1 Tax=uncultured Acinetobacter sp. TaxID=165433 RepID=UPI0026117F22|nr:TonB-dependent copper receptor [uncultured Acinetobacter sp.]
MRSGQFLLQPLVATMAIAYSTTTLAVETPTHALTAIVATAQTGNDANGLIVRADPKQPIQPIPASDGADYLQSIVGFSAVNSGAGTNGDVTFRGMFGSRIKILTDGTENLGACPSRMDSPTSYISPESYDQISVIKGPQTVQYANTGSAATVIFERRPEDFSQDQNYRGQASVVVGSYGRLDQNIEAAVGDEQKYIRLNTNRSVSNSYQDGDGKTVPSDWKRWNADIALGWTPNADTWVELTGGKADGEAVYAGRAMDGSKFARESLGLRVEKKNVSDVIEKIEAQINYNFNDHVMDNYSLRKPPMMQMATNVARKTLNARLAMTQEWDNMNLITGIDTQNNEHSIRKTDAMQGIVYQDQPRMTDMKFQSFGGFGELTYQFGDENRLVSGVRIDQVEVKDQRNVTASLDKQREHTLFSGFVRFENTHPDHDDGKTYIGLGYVERMPDYWELFSPKSGNGQANTFNQIDTEKTFQLDLGYQHQYAGFNSWASAYVGLIQDYILTTYLPTGANQALEAHSRNVDATIAGAEAGVGYQFSDAIQADVSAMYAWGKNTSNNTPLPQISPLEGRINLRYVQDNYNLGLLWRIVDGQSRISEREGNIVGYDVKKSTGFGTLSLNGTYKLAQDVDLSVGIDNVLNKTYAEHLNKLGNAGLGFAATEQFNNIGRNYWTRLNMKF